MEPTQTFLDEVREAWGEPGAVAAKALDELFRHGDWFSLDHDDQVNYALQIGTLAGKMQDQGPDEFIRAFTEKFFNE